MAENLNATLVTGEPEFKAFKGEVKINWIGG